VPAVLMVFVWGCIHFAAGAPLQARIVDQAKGAPNLASTLNQGAFNLGNALGASLGGIMLTEGVGYRYLSLGSAAVASVALLVALIALRVERSQRGSAEENQMVSV
jgi:MFS transporter, DHA1 family, inner membrane transport protein